MARQRIQDQAADGLLDDDAFAREAIHPASREDVELYIRTYNTLLRSSGPIRLRTLVPAHLAMESSLHPKGSGEAPDLSAFIYSTLRLPTCMGKVSHVLLGQSAEVFARAGYADVTSWHIAAAEARRRFWYFDGVETLAVETASTSDVDDLVPTLVAYQIEWNKFHALFELDASLVEELRTAAQNAAPLAPELAERLRARLRLEPADWERLEGLWNGALGAHLLEMAERDKQFVLRMLGGSHVGYARATRRWWSPTAELIKRLRLEGAPVYFVSSNTHSLVNLVSGFALRRRAEIEERVRQVRDPELLPEYEKLRSGRTRGNWENFLYYSARKLLLNSSDAVERVEIGRARTAEEEERGISWVRSREGLRVDVQLVQLSKLRPEDLDPRVRVPSVERLRESDAVIVNIDYPLGLAAYHVLVQLAESLDSLKGIYILGKAATLNGDVGDVMISDVVHDEHSGNTYWVDNSFGANDIADLLTFGSVLDHQRAVAVKSTYLQNRQHLDFYYRENYTVVEMETGPYLSALYEMSHPTRYPTGELVSLNRLPLEIGLLHYASDTPYTRGKNLGARRISFYGMDSAYAASVAILRRIFRRELGSTIDEREPGLLLRS